MIKIDKVGRQATHLGRVVTHLEVISKQKGLRIHIHRDMTEAL